MWGFFNAAHLCVNPPWELGLRHHDNDTKHAEDEGVVAETLALFKQRPPMAELVADVLVPFVRCVAGILTQRLARLVTVALWHHDLKAGGVERLQRLRLWVQISQVPAAQRSHHAAIVLTAVHGYLRERGAAGRQRRARPSMAQPAAIRTHLTHGHTGERGFRVLCNQNKAQFNKLSVAVGDESELNICARRVEQLMFWKFLADRI